jgi:hypothetical protein
MVVLRRKAGFPPDLGKSGNVSKWYATEPEEEIVTVKEEVEQWDCETILTTYSTLENHPSLIAPVQARACASTQTAKTVQPWALSLQPLWKLPLALPCLVGKPEQPFRFVPVE